METDWYARGYWDGTANARFEPPVDRDARKLYARAYRAVCKRPALYVLAIDMHGDQDAIHAYTPVSDDELR